MIFPTLNYRSRLVADFFGLRRKIIKYEAEKTEIDLFKTILDAEKNGNKHISICGPNGASDYQLNLFRSYGLKAQNVLMRDGTYVCVVQWGL